MRWLLPLALTVTIGFAQPLINPETVLVGDPGNARDSLTLFTGVPGNGAVAYEFRISKYETTIGQYVVFLNSVAKTPQNTGIRDLWTGSMGSSATPVGATILRTGEGTLDKPYVYTAANTRGGSNRPVVFVSWLNAARFANWLHNGADSDSDTEDGAYTLSTATNNGGLAPLRNQGARWWIPSTDEWYKAAHYKGGGTNSGYWPFATRSQTLPTAEPNPPGGPNSANYNYAVPSLSGGGIIDVGSYLNSPGPYGTFDQHGNVAELVESQTVVGVTYRGGSFTTVQHSGWGQIDYFSSNTSLGYTVGFRVATTATNTNSAPLRILSAAYHTDGFAISWNSPANVRVQRRTSLLEGQWQTISSNNTAGSYFDSAAPSNRAFYRLIAP